MLEVLESADVAKLPLAPKNPLPYRHQLSAVRSLIDGFQELFDAGGPITRLVLGPKWLFPTVVLIASPQGARDVLGRTDEIADRGGATMAIQLRRLMGGNLLVLPHEQWLPRRRALQPMFTKLQVPRYAGHMAAAAQTVVDGWRDGASVDLDTECRRAYPAGARPLGARRGPRRQGRHRRAGAAHRTHLGRRPRDPAGESRRNGCPPPASGGPAGPMQTCIGWPPRSSPRCEPTPTETHHWCVP